MEYRSKYKAEEIEAILDAKNNTGEGVDSNLDELFTGQLQTKEVEVSEDTTIKADEGFLGLKEVSVKVSGGGESTMEYLDVSGVEDATLKKLLVSYAEYMKIASPEGGLLSISVPIFFVSQGGLDLYVEPTLAIAFDFTKKVFIQGDYQPTAVEFNGMSTEAIAAIPRITEEEFYTL